MATKAAESAVWGGSAWTGLQPAGVAKARQTWLGKPWSLGFGQADPWGPEGAGLESAEGSLSQLNPDGEQRLPQRGGRRERWGARPLAWPYDRWRGRTSVGVAVRPLAWPNVPGNPMLARLLLTLVGGQEPLSTTLGRLGCDMVKGAEGPTAGELLAECGSWLPR